MFQCVIFKHSNCDRHSCIPITGKSTGFVTTARGTHATPAAMYAHTVNRDWESDRDLPWNSAQTCPDIAAQLVLNNSGINVQL